MPQELDQEYKAKAVERRIYDRWLEKRAFAATPDERENRYVVMMPLPNVTGALHMGHAMDNVMQDLLIRWHRMRGDNTLWMAGTDHAGIATQSVVETRLKDLEGKTRHDIGRDALVERIWEWKEVCQKRIISQQQAMGCSCDWERTRFTLDDVCARAVTHTFFKLFKDGLIFQGNRLVNWDCHLQTAVANDEVEHRKTNGHFYHLKYPVIDPKPGEPTHIIVATTRPETMLGDTAVACHPTPARQLDKLITKAQEEEKPELVESLEARKASHLAQLEQLAAMAEDGRMVMLPLQNRPIPLITDIWAKPELGSGCVKITPAHDPNDHDVWSRHADHIDIINILNPDGTINAEGGDYALDRFAARKKIVADFDANGLLAEIEDREIEVGHSDRSKTPIEPLLSLQWFVRMGDIDGGIICGRGTKKEFTAPGLAQAAIDAVEGRSDWTSATGKDVTFHPDHQRYGNTYVNWLAEKRDWCISRQLWWGHRIPIWARTGTASCTRDIVDTLHSLKAGDKLHYLIREEEDGATTLLVCLRDPAADSELVAHLEANELERDPDVLDTWFSSALWPHSTLGWPDPPNAPINEGQPKLDDCLDYYYPGSCLVTGRDIITLWVARMVITGLYNLGDVPFTDVFIHANIMDGKGERMSKSKGNGIDPVDISKRYGTDAMRYCLSDMQTGLQDIRLPVQVDSPFTGNTIELHKAKHGRTKFTYLCPETGKEFDVLGTMPDLPAAQPYSSRFEEGQKFCTKLWNAARFTFGNLDGVAYRPLDLPSLAPEDRWILSRLSQVTRTATTELDAYNPSASIGAIRDFFWGELCDWYLEIVKPRVRGEGESAANAKQILAACLDQVLRLLHPFVPYITEELWTKLQEIAPERGITETFATHELLCLAPFPKPHPAWEDDSLIDDFAFSREVIRGIREIRNRYTLPPKQELHARIKATGNSAERLEGHRELITQMAVLSQLEVSGDIARTADSATGIVGDMEIYIPGAVDLEKEKARLAKQLEKTAKQLEGTKKKLANENFTSRAKPEVVEKERSRLTELETQVHSLEATLAELG